MARFGGSGSALAVAPAAAAAQQPVISEGPDNDYDDPFTQQNSWYVPAVENRVLIANRVTGVFQPGPSYANTDPQKGGAPGDPGTVEGSQSAGITSQGPTGVTTVAGVPSSAMKLSFGESDYSSFYPTALPAHQAISPNANPNRPQVNPTPFNYEGPSANTQYATPAPWAAGTFIG
jgi:hypothetical protein